MKKLLALILCVVMVMSLAPMAFAAGTTGGVAWDYVIDRQPNYDATSVAKSTIKDLNKDINAMYYAITTDEVVYASAKGIYDFTDNLAKDLLKGIDKYEFLDGRVVYEDDLASNLRKGLNRVIGDEIANYMNERIDTWTDSGPNGTGRIKADKYLDTYVKALNKALGSEKAAKNLEAIMLGVYTMKLQKDVNDRADDLYDEINAWDKWAEFGWGDITNPKFNNYYSGWKPIVNATDVDGDGVADIGGAVLLPTGSADATADSMDSHAYFFLHG